MAINDSVLIAVPLSLVAWYGNLLHFNAAIQPAAMATPRVLTHVFHAGQAAAILATILVATDAALALTLVTEELGIGLMVGVGLVAIAAPLVKACNRQGWVTDIWVQVTIIALAIE